jgi:hypothetical protein
MEKESEKKIAEIEGKIVIIRSVHSFYFLILIDTLKNFSSNAYK